MPSLIHPAALVALAGIALAIPAPEDACLAAVTGKAGNPDEAARKQHCSGFLQYTTTAPPVIATTTSAGSWSPLTPNADSSPNDVPDWAKACDKDSYKSACKKWNVIETTTTTTPPRTLTTTIYVEDKSTGKPSTPDPWVGSPPTGPAPGSKPGDCSPVTVTITKGDSKPTSGPSPGQGSSGKCLSDEKAAEFVNAFKDLLEYTSYNGTQGAPGRGYHFNVSAKYLAPDFQDYSDSINYMAGFPLGSVTFPNRTAFDYGQGILQPELKVETKFIAHSCKDITWKWVATTQTRANVMGINFMTLNDDLTQIKVNHAEFNNANWINSFGIPGVNCKVPQ